MSLQMSLALCSPMPRMIFVVVWHCKGVCHEILPVVAIRATALFNPQDDSINDHCERLDAIVLEGRRLISVRDFLSEYDGPNVMLTSTFVAPWPAEEDEERMAGWIKEAKANLAKRKP